MPLVGVSIIKCFGSGLFSAGCSLFFPLLPSADFLAFPGKKRLLAGRFVFDLRLYDLQLPLIELFYFPLRNGVRVYEAIIIIIETV